MTEPGFLFERDEGRRRVVITLRARATMEVWWTTVSTVVAENAWGDSVIYDMSAVASAPLLVNLPNLVQIVRQLTSTHGQPGPTAVVVAENDVDLWRQRLAVVFGDSLIIDVFSDVTSAHRWLDRVGRPNAS
jgi:hypothetical protein